MNLFNITLRDLMYCFKNTNFIIWFDNGYIASYTMDWDTCWKYARDRQLLDRKVKSAHISFLNNNTIDINI